MSGKSLAAGRFCEELTGIRENDSTLGRFLDYKWSRFSLLLLAAMLASR